jgi:hypothetical protein
MERGLNVAAGSRKGARSYLRLNTLRTKLILIARRFQEAYGVACLTDVSEEQLHTFSGAMRSGALPTCWGRPYRATRDYGRRAWLRREVVAREAHLYWVAVVKNQLHGCVGCDPLGRRIEPPFNLTDLQAPEQLNVGTKRWAWRDFEAQHLRLPRGRGLKCQSARTPGRGCRSSARRCGTIPSDRRQ